MDEFNDSDISSLLNQIAGSSPDTMTAHKAVLGKVRRVRQRRVMAVSTAAVVMVVSGAVAMVQNSDNRGGGSNIAVPLSPGDSQPVKVATTVGLAATTTTIEGSISIDPIVTDPPIGTPTTQPSSVSTSPSNSSVIATTLPTNTQAPTHSQSPSISTIPANTPSTATTKPPVTTPPVTKAPIVASPPTTQPPIVTNPPTTQTPIVTNPPTTQTPIATSPPTTRAPIVTSPPTTQPPVTAPPTTLPEPKIWSCGGGSVKYLVTANGLVLLEMTPAVGFTVSKAKAKTDEITVKFDASIKNDKRTSALKIKKSGLVSNSCEDENFNSRSDSEDSDSNDNNEESADD